MTKDYAPGIMSPEEFQKQGLLLEVNRQFLHPLGLALPIGQDPKTGDWKFTAIKVAEDPEGIVFSEEVLSKDKIDLVRALQAEKHHTRLEKLGYVVQPAPGQEPDPSPQLDRDEAHKRAEFLTGRPPKLVMHEGDAQILQSHYVQLVDMVRAGLQKAYADGYEAGVRNAKKAPHEPTSEDDTGPSTTEEPE
jgi:hypothetical protein